jgi:uroporphyrin-III C-methyltransferase / precorrin-2 dehydrogenase / sirohydrochlorin ferrochelatase
MRYFPIFVDLKDRKVIVVGGGEEALRKVRLLLKTKARILVVAPLLHDELAAEPRVEWLATQFSPKQLDGTALVYAAEPAINEVVSAEARARGIPVNVIDVAEISTFLTPSIVDRDPVVIAIGTEGTAPVLGQGIRARLDAELPQALGDLATKANALRSRVAKEVPHGNRRRSFWAKFFFGRIRDAVVAGDAADYAHELTLALKDDAAPSIGRVSIVGAGPGDPELLTLKAQRKLLEADVIVYDRNVCSNILELARRDAERFAVSTTQSDIGTLLARHAQAGKHVVFLVSGDVDHGSEEVAVLEQHGFAVDVVPGIASETAKPFPFMSRDDIATEMLRAAS